MAPRPGNWTSICAEVFRRDKGICDVCGLDLNKDPESYECGHLVDRCAGGSDKLDNLRCMCILCNRLKPVHDTLYQYAVWRSDVIFFSEVFPLSSAHVIVGMFGGDHEAFLASARGG